MIVPSVGRICIYHPNRSVGDPQQIDETQPYAAIVTLVTNERLVNLCVWTHAGFPFAKQGVALAQDSDHVEQGMAEWMPYQKGQAAKTDAAEAAAREDSTKPVSTDAKKGAGDKNSGGNKPPSEGR